MARRRTSGMGLYRNEGPESWAATKWATSVLPPHRGLAHCRVDAHRPAPGRPEHGPVHRTRCGVDLAGLIHHFRCRIAIHLDPLHRSPRRGRRAVLHRLRRRLVRQRPRPDDHRPLQDRMRPPRRPVPHRRRARAGHAALGRLVQHDPAALLDRGHSTHRVRTGLLPSEHQPGDRRDGSTQPPLNPGRFTMGRPQHPSTSDAPRADLHPQLRRAEYGGRGL